MQAEDRFWTIFFFIVIIGFFVAIIVLIATEPYPVYPYYRDASPLKKGDAAGRSKCTVSEEYNEELELCAPIVNIPVPISSDMMDMATPACDSFFRHASGKWIDSHTNENRAFTYVFRKNQKQVHDIIRSKDSGPVNRFYRSCIDTLVHRLHPLIDKSQARHVNEHILGALKTHGDLPIVFARMARYGFTSPFIFTIEAHPTEFRMIPLIRRDEFHAPLEVLATQFGLSVVDLLEVQRKMQSWYTDREFQGDFVDYVRSTRYDEDIFNMSSLIDASPPNFWKLYLRELNGFGMEEEIDIPSQSVWVLDRGYLMNLLHNLKDLSVEQWRSYVELSIVYNTNDFLPHLNSDSYFRVHNPIERHVHIRHRIDRAKRTEYTDQSCLSLTHKLLPGMIGNMFLARSLPNTSHVRQQVTEVVKHVRDALIDVVQNTSWLQQHNKDELSEKLRAIIVRSVMPNFYEEEAIAERLTTDCYLRNLNIVRQYLVTKNFELWTKDQPNRDFIQRFNAPLTEVNAFYSPVTNTITIFGGILHKPFYDQRFPELALYATVGLIAAHELSHAIDVNGRLFDKDGSLMRREPWSSAELQEFNRRTDLLVQEYEAPFGCDNAQYGQQTLGEDMSDLNGLKAAYYAYFNRHPDATRQQKQWFFIIFAQMWAESYTKEQYCERVKNDVHAIAAYRVDKTLRQLKEFREAFNCKDGDNMVNANSAVIYGE